MAVPRDDTYQRLKSEVDSWAAEVSQMRSALAQPIRLKVDTTRPAFRLDQTRSVSPIAPPETHSVLSEIAAEAQARVRTSDDERRRLEAELEFAREQLIQRNTDAIEAARISEEKSEQLEEVARAFGRARIELDETVQQLRSKEWALLQIQNENALMRGDGTGRVPLNTVPVEDYDSLVASHMSLRAHVNELQERVIQRDHEVVSLREQLAAAHQELTAWESASPVNGAGLARLAGVLADRSAALEQYEESAIGQKFLIGALRQELDAVRAALDQRDLDHDRLAQALRMETDCLRAIASEREFVIGHQAHAIEGVARREADLSAELTELREMCESLRRRAEHTEAEREAMDRDAQLLRAKLSEREAEVWKLRSAPTVAAPAPESERAPGLAQLQSALVARDAELERARERIEFLRSLTREAQPPVAALPVHRPLGVSGRQQPKEPVVLKEDINVDLFQMNSALQREVEEALSLRFPWPLIAVLGGIAGLGLLSVGLLALFLA